MARKSSAEAAAKKANHDRATSMAQQRNKGRDRWKKDDVVGSPEGVRILQPEQMDPLEINPSVYNPRKITVDQLAALKRSIRENGFIEPLVVQRGTRTLIGGHQRLRALREICEEDAKPLPSAIPVVVLDVDDHRAKIINIGLNKIGGDFDGQKLALLLEDLGKSPTFKDEIALTGFAESEIDKLLARVKEPTPPKTAAEDLAVFGRSVTLSLEFTDTKLRDKVARILKARARSQDKKSGDIVWELLTGKS